MAKTNSMKPIDAPVFGYWSALYRSFYSKRLYIDVGKRWAGYGLRYLLLLVALWSIPISVEMSTAFDELYNQQLIEPLSAIPLIYIQNGEAKFDKPMPYFVKNKKDQVILIVDTTGAIDNFSNKYPYLAVIVNKNKIALKIPKPVLPGGIGGQANNVTPLVQMFAKNDNSVLDGKKIVQQDAVNKWRLIAQLTIYPVAFVSFFSMFLVMFLVLGFLGQLFARAFFSFKITLKQASKLLIVAATPMMLVLLFMLLFSLTFPGFGFLLIAILALFFTFAVYSLRSESNRLVAE